jgi:pimeloyl-ACP methyl ester carboxylesterase
VSDGLPAAAIAGLVNRQPVAILGGFMSVPRTYWLMRDRLAELTGQPVLIADVGFRDWARSVSDAGWARILDKLALVARQLARQSPTGKITLVGHSAGGVMARLYLSDRPFQERTYSGLGHVNALITLGSPHNERSMQMQRWLNGEYPGVYFAPCVCYVSIAGKAVQGRRDGSFGQRLAYRSYLGLSGVGDEWGDGLVPISSAILPDSRPVVLDGVSHFSLSMLPWYGSAEVVPRWWTASAKEGESICAGPEQS